MYLPGPGEKDIFRYYRFYLAIRAPKPFLLSLGLCGFVSSLSITLDYDSPFPISERVYGR